MENLKNGTKIIAPFNRTIICEGNNLYMYDKETRGQELFRNYNFLILEYNFEILSEEDEEIDIEAIEELNDTNYDVKNMTDEEFDEYHKITRTRLNEIIRVVKQLNKQMKEK